MGYASALQSPIDAQQRFACANEMYEAVSVADPDRMWSCAVWWRLYSSLQMADLASADRDIEQFIRSNEETREPFNVCLIKHFRACEASIDGRFVDFERLAQEALAIGQTLEIENAAGIFGTQMFSLRREQGRLREVESLLRHFIGTREGVHAWRPGLALIYAELGRTEEARTEFGELAQHDFADLPRDGNWLIAMTFLADVCVMLGDKSHAQALYNLMLPYEEVNIIVSVGAACYGSAARFVGALAALLGRLEEAEQHFNKAMAMNGRMNAQPWLAHTKYQYARMLLSRDQTGDREKASGLIKDALATARELGMSSLERRITSGAP